MSVLVLYSLRRLNIYSSKLNQLLHKTFNGERPILEGNELRCVMGIPREGLNNNLRSTMIMQRSSLPS